MYADVIVNISVESLDKTYQYLIPDNMTKIIKPGVRVNIPFGNRKITGYVIDVSDKPKIDEGKIKPIISPVEKSNSIDENMIALAWWIKEQFGGTMNQSLKTVIPVTRQVKAVEVRTITPKVGRAELESLYNESLRKKNAVNKQRFLRELIDVGSLDYSLATHKLNISGVTIKKLEADGVIAIRSETTYRNPFSGMDRSMYQKPVLNDEQQTVADGIIGDIMSGKRADCLIHGITGSGKTEVYLDVIEKVIADGKQVIMLIPEIALTYQTVKRFYLRFGDRISVMNSKLSLGERYDQYLRAKRGETDIVIGPRSALFTPFDRLGLIIIDEEHEGSYRAENAPAYSAREVAFHRADMEGASVILGSATPSIEAYTMAKAGRIRLYSLKNRAGGAAMPTVHVADMREELKAGNRSMFSNELKRLIAERLAKHEQIMLFLNRRGYSGSVSCRSCGYVIKCPHCDLSLTLHNTGRMTCHYCGYTINKPEKCPKCGSPYISSFGLGTQKVEEKLKEMYPDARVLRMDADTTGTKDSYDNILSAFANEEADILIGTQMIVKGHDFHKCTLVGIMMADMSLYAPDFRAGERTFQLLTQAAGRAGRGELHGDVVIQTYNPDHYCIETASRADYEAFYAEEYGFRCIMNYPPSRCMLSILVECKNEHTAEGIAESVKDIALHTISRANSSDISVEKRNKASVIGPADAPLAKANDYYRKILYVKARDYALLVAIKNAVTEYEFQTSDKYMIEFNFN